jgi:hypothetical protein
MTPTEALEQAAVALDEKARWLNGLARGAAVERRSVRNPTEQCALAVYESELRAKAQGVALAAEMIRERARSLRGEDAA